jgi:tetratricopeptide (TPR) repeat protein
MIKTIRHLALCCLLLSAGACMSQRQGPVGPPPVDPISSVSAGELRAKGLAFARRGDLTRAQQYLSAAQQKGYDESVIVPEIVKICVAASRLRAALAFAEPYLERYPEDAGMKYVVGTIHFALGDLQRATAHLSGALRPSAIMIDAAFSLALIAHDQGQPQEARLHLKRYLKVQPRGRFATRAKHLLAKLSPPPKPRRVKR